jgi:hypothetical protein
VFAAAPTLSYQNVGNNPDINPLMNNIRVTVTYELMPKARGDDRGRQTGKQFWGG